MRTRAAIPMATILAVVLAAPGGAAMAQDGEPVVIFSTDYGLGVIGGASNGPDRHAADVDDAYAVSLALAAADVRAVITTYGNTKARPSAESARRGLAALGVPDPDVLVTVGSEGFIDAEPVSFEPTGGPSTPLFCVDAGVERMAAEIAAQEAGTVTLVAIGPLTDVACLGRAHPDAYADLAGIVILAGSSDGTPSLQGIDVVDFNYAMDPTALGEVIASQAGVPVTLLMIEVTQLGTLSNETIADWASDGSDAQRYYAAATQPHASYWDAIFTDTDGQALFDAHTVYWLLHPEAYTCREGMLATATVGGYPDLSASTTKNTLSVVPADDPVTPGVDVDGSTYTYTGPVRGCSAFASDDGVEAFVAAVEASIAGVPADPS